MPPDAKRSPAGNRRPLKDQPSPQEPPGSVDQPVASATRFRPGDVVHCERATPARGSWKRYAGRTGTLITINVARSVNGSPDVVEIGVDLDSDGRADAWFHPDELVILDTPHATSGRLADVNGEVGR